MSLVSAPVVLAGGVLLIALLILQILIGLRKIKFKGRTHMKVHRWVAYAMLAVALGHAFLALALLGYIRL